MDLPILLAALSGAGSSEPYPQGDLQVGPAVSTFDFFASLEHITLPVESIGEYLTTGVDSSGRVEIATTRKLQFADGQTLTAGTKGTLLITDATTGVQYVKLEARYSGWSLLFAMLRCVVGLGPQDMQVSRDYLGPNIEYVSMARLGADFTSVASAGLRLLQSVLHPTFRLGSAVIEKLSTGIENPAIAVLEVALTVLDRARGAALSPEDSDIVQLSLGLIGSVMALPGPSHPLFLRNSSFFGGSSKRRSIAADLIHQDSSGRSDHVVILSIIRLISSIVVGASAESGSSNDGLVRSALHLAFDSIWMMISGWRFRDVAEKYLIVSLLSSAFASVLRHPLVPGQNASQAASYLIEVFVNSSSTMVYRPISDTVVHGTALAEQLLAKDCRADATAVIESMENTLGMLTSLLRISYAMKTSSRALPKSLLSSPVVNPSGKKIQLVDHLFELATYPSLPASTRLAVLRLLRAYLEVTAQDEHRPSLAALLSNANDSCRALETLATAGETDTIKAVTWNLLASIISTQPGCAFACIGSTATELSGPLLKAVERVISFDEIIGSSPQVLSASLGYCVAVLLSPSSTDALKALRAHPDFWTAVFELSTRTVPSPPTFALSMHADDFSARIEVYTYTVQAKANATSLLAAELALIAEGDEEERSQVKDQVVGLFKSGASLTEASTSAIHNSCYPGLHEEQQRRLLDLHIDLPALKTIALPVEREFGRTYLYDGDAIVARNDVAQATINLALDLLNLNWSMIDADVALTKAFRALAETASVWTEDDPMTSAPALKASVAISALLAEEDRGGDVMLAIQVERLDILVILLEMACAESAESDSEQLTEVCSNTRRILENPSFPPMASLRHSELPALHKPILRILFLVLQALFRSKAQATNIDSTITAATSFTLQAANVVLDELIRRPNAPESLAYDLGSIVGVLCEVATAPNAEVWLERVVETNFIVQGQEIIRRCRIANDSVPPQVASVLLLHLALASNPAFAEKIAMSNILPAYAHSAIAVEAEKGSIVAPPLSQSPNSVHGTWCGILIVIKALLSSLTPARAANFARNEVMPFIKVCRTQLLKALQWNGEAQLSKPALDELELVIDVYNGVAASLGDMREELLEDLMEHLLALLKSIRFALSHPRLLSTLFTPSSEEERTALEAEFEAMDGVKDQDELLDFKRAPIVAGRTLVIMGVARSAVLTLISLTRAWDAVRGDDETHLAKVLETEVSTAITGSETRGQY